MGRSFESVRQGVNRKADRWSRIVRSLDPKRRNAGTKLVALAKQHSSEAFICMSDPVEAMLFSGCVELNKAHDNSESGEDEAKTGVRKSGPGSESPAVEEG